MANLTSVTVTNGVPTAGTGTVSTFDNLPNLVMQTKVTDGTNTAAVVPANTAPTAAMPAQVVALSPNGLNSNGQALMANSAPMVLASDQTIPVKATTTTNGTTKTRIVSAASTNATSVKTSPGKVMSLRIFNTASYAVFFKFYDKASVPTLALATPVNSSFSTSTTGGTLAAGTYYYRVSAINANGETLASAETSQVTTGTTSTVTVNWGAVTGATGYKVYGRTTGAELFIASVGAVTTYTDTGSITPSGALPAANTTADTPTWTIPLEAGTGFSENFVIGDDFTAGIAYAITKLQADSDTTAVAAGDVTGKMHWI